MLYKKILVPHAETKDGDEALKHAIFASTDASKIIILHIVEAI
ncbi:universal stress protein [Nitrosopumilus ureiphilus]|nr:universal stress protein [Nitrosopumilus ureiphilus]